MDIQLNVLKTWKPNIKRKIGRPKLQDKLFQDRYYIINVYILKQSLILYNTYLSMSEAVTKASEEKNSHEASSNKKSEKKPIYIWLEKEQRFARRVRFHVKKYYSLHSASMSIFFRKYADLDEGGRQQVKDRFKAGEEFCLKDKETSKEIAAWYICFNELILYAEWLLDGAKADREGNHKVLLQDSIKKIVYRWEKIYPCRLEERRVAEQRQKLSIFEKVVRSIGVFFQRNNEKTNRILETPLLSRKIQPQV